MQGGPLTALLFFSQTSAVPTVRNMLRQGAQHLAGDAARREAEILLAHALGKSRAWLVAHTDAEVEGTQRATFDSLIAGRAAGDPVAYLVGTCGFHALELEVTPDVLIPRPETELLVELALARFPVGSPDEATQRRNPGKPTRAFPDLFATSMSLTLRTGCAVRVCNPANAVAAPHPGYAVADLGTGSGAIALAIAKARPHARLLATDASEAALAVARRNAVRLGLDNVAFARGDWCAALGAAHFDLIVCNPPYIAEDDPHLREDDLRFEPPLALSSGADGLDAIRAIVRDAIAHLSDGGWLLLEHGFEQGAAVRTLLGRAGYRDVFTERDLEGRERVSGGRLV